MIVILKKEDVLESWRDKPIETIAKAHLFGHAFRSILHATIAILVIDDKFKILKTKYKHNANLVFEMNDVDAGFENFMENLTWD